MISQPIKDLYYASFGKLSALSFLLCRLWGRRRFQGAFVNIGCGRNYVAGMINVDGNIMRKKDLWLDVTLGLPFPDNSIEGIYASHMIEHLSLKRVRKLFAEFYRVLKPGARVRLVVPSLEYAIEAYLRRNGNGLPDWPEKLNSPGGRFNNLMLCANQHLILFDFSLLQELLAASGFTSALREAPLSSSYFGAEHMQFESDPALIDKSLHVEAIK
jgi:predicted SAM-dependent methyltransferase